MDFSLTEEQRMLRAMVRDFAEKELEPIAAEIDEEASFPAEQVKKMMELGLAGVSFPENYGGSGGGKMEEVIVTEELSRVSAAVGIILIVSAGVAGCCLYRFGNEEQRQRFVVPVAKGEKLACFALTLGRMVGIHLTELKSLSPMELKPTLLLFLLPLISRYGTEALPALSWRRAPPVSQWARSSVSWVLEPHQRPN